MQHSTHASERSQSLWWDQPFVYWQANQVVITFHTPSALPGSTEEVENVVSSLKLDVLAQFLASHDFHLKSFTTKDVPRPEKESPEEGSWQELAQLEEELERLEAEIAFLECIPDHRTPFSQLRGSDGQAYKTPGQRDLEELEVRIEELEREIERRERLLHKSDSRVVKDGLAGKGSHSGSLNSAVGKYLFASSTGQGTLAVCFFNIVNPALAPTSSGYGHSKQVAPAPDTTRAIVTLLNHNLNTLRQDGNIPIIAAMPNWIGGVTRKSANCPADPPIPLTGDNATYNNWHFTLPQLSPALRDLQGDDVTMFVLDTIPRARHITEAAQRAGDHNVLLKDFAENMQGASPSIVIDYQSVPKRLDGVHTGKDLNDRFYSFEVPDHGLFVSGIIHDLAPRAKIECVRVLNDSGIGDIMTLCAALQAIQKRMAQQKLKKVVVNLSLIITPPDENLPGIWFGDTASFQTQELAAVRDDIEHLRLGLHSVIKSLIAQGAVIVASAGNESNMLKNPQRFGPRHPAAFPEVISVGSLDKYGQATTYSDYPALPPEDNGIATYGGAIPKAAPPAQPQPSEPKPPGAETWADVEDAVVGLYSFSHYPKLLATDQPPPVYAAPPHSYCWAYWSGTSFSTPIISALAARVLQAQQQGILPAGMSVMDLITTGTGQQLLTAAAALPNNTGFGVGIGMLEARQEHA